MRCDRANASWARITFTLILISIVAGIARGECGTGQPGVSVEKKPQAQRRSASRAVQAGRRIENKKQRPITQARRDYMRRVSSQMAEAKELIGLGEYSAASARLETFAAQSPAEPGFVLLLSEVLVRTGRDRDAAVLLRGLLKESAPGTRSRLGFVLAREGDLAGSLALGPVDHALQYLEGSNAPHR